MGSDVTIYTYTLPSFLVYSSMNLAQKRVEHLQNATKKADFAIFGGFHHVLPQYPPIIVTYDFFAITHSSQWYSIDFGENNFFFIFFLDL